MDFPVNHPQFVTITVHEWKHLLKPDKYKKIIIDSLAFLVEQKRIKLFAFVIMNNHMHFIWQIQANHTQSNVQRDFLKFVAQKIKFDLIKYHPKVLEKFAVSLNDRKYQFWKRNSLSVELYSPAVFEQKLTYIHQNPVKSGLCRLPEEYNWSSARFYIINEKNFSFLSHYEE